MTHSKSFHGSPRELLLQVQLTLKMAIFAFLMVWDLKNQIIHNLLQEFYMHILNIESNFGFVLKSNMAVILRPYLRNCRVRDTQLTTSTL